jgi:hypothetical protein
MGRHRSKVSSLCGVSAGEAHEVAGKARGYLRLADRLLPEQVTGFYLVGSAALGEYVPGRSDLDLVAIVADDPGEHELRRLRLLHVLAGAQSAATAIAARRSPLTGTRNGVFVRSRDIARPLSEIVPVAAHTGVHFASGEAFDVNPVVWKVFRERGIALRGPEPAALGLDDQPDLLREWNLDNLATYWRRWGESASRGRGLWSHRLRYGWAWMVAWGVLGAPRLHCTVATGQVIGKLSAGDYALRTFPERWHELIRTALAYWRREPVTVHANDVRTAGDFVLAVVEAAHSLP